MLNGEISRLYPSPSMRRRKVSMGSDHVVLPTIVPVRLPRAAALKAATVRAAAKRQGGSA
jgi:hypothetical protein